jgi:hypothetical protein
MDIVVGNERFLMVLLIMVHFWKNEPLPACGAS